MLNSKLVEKKIKPCFAFLSKSAIKGKEKTTKFCLTRATSTRLLAEGTGRAPPPPAPPPCTRLVDQQDSFSFVETRWGGGGKAAVDGGGRLGGGGQGRQRDNPLPHQVPPPAWMTLQPGFSEREDGLREETGQSKANALSYKLYCTCAKAR